MPCCAAILKDMNFGFGVHQGKTKEREGVLLRSGSGVKGSFEPAAFGQRGNDASLAQNKILKHCCSSQGVVNPPGLLDLCVNTVVFFPCPTLDSASSALNRPKTRHQENPCFVGGPGVSNSVFRISVSTQSNQRHHILPLFVILFKGKKRDREKNLQLFSISESDLSFIAVDSLQFPAERQSCVSRPFIVGYRVYGDPGLFGAFSVPDIPLQPLCDNFILRHVVLLKRRATAFLSLSKTSFSPILLESRNVSSLTLTKDLR